MTNCGTVSRSQVNCAKEGVTQYQDDKEKFTNGKGREWGGTHVNVGRVTARGLRNWLLWDHFGDVCGRRAWSAGIGITKTQLAEPTLQLAAGSVQPEFRATLPAFADLKNNSFQSEGKCEHVVDVLGSPGDGSLVARRSGAGHSFPRYLSCWAGVKAGENSAANDG